MKYLKQKSTWCLKYWHNFFPSGKAMLISERTKDCSEEILKPLCLAEELYLLCEQKHVRFC